MAVLCGLVVTALGALCRAVVGPGSCSRTTLTLGMGSFIDPVLTPRVTLGKGGVGQGHELDGFQGGPHRAGRDQCSGSYPRHPRVLEKHRLTMLLGTGLLSCRDYP